MPRSELLRAARLAATRPAFGLAECRPCGWVLRCPTLGEAEAATELHNAGVPVVQAVSPRRTGIATVAVTAVRGDAA